MSKKSKEEARYQAKLQAEMEAAARDYDERREARWLDEASLQPLERGESQKSNTTSPQEKT